MSSVFGVDEEQMGLVLPLENVLFQRNRARTLR